MSPAAPPSENNSHDDRCGVPPDLVGRRADLVAPSGYARSYDAKSIWVLIVIDHHLPRCATELPFLPDGHLAGYRASPKFTEPRRGHIPHTLLTTARSFAHKKRTDRAGVKIARKIVRRLMVNDPVLLQPSIPRDELGTEPGAIGRRVIGVL
jgi:hypothetical protein